MISQTLSSISSDERRFVLCASLLFCLIISAPYLYGWMTTPAGALYTGIHNITIGDFSNYFSMIAQVSHGHFFIPNLSAHDAMQVKDFRFFWSEIGIFARIFHLSAPLAFHLVRVLSSLVFVVLGYFFISLFTKSVWQRKFTWLLLLFSGGVGAWFYIFYSPVSHPEFYADGFYHWPMDLWVAESSTFLTLYHSPHLVVGTLLYVLILFLFFYSLERRRYAYSLMAGLLTAYLLLWHPFHVVSLGLITLVYAFIRFVFQAYERKRLFLSFFILWTLGLPSFGYHVYETLTRSDVAYMAAANFTPTPAWWIVFISYGFLMVFSLVAIFSIIREKHISPIWFFLLAWLFIQFFCIFFAVPWQRKLTQGLHIPLVIFAGSGVYIVKEWIATREKFIHDILFSFLGIFFFIFIFAFSPLFMVISDFEKFTTHKGFPFYIPADYYAAYQWVRTNTPPESAVLSGFWSGNFTPGFILRPAFQSHGILTIDFGRKLEETKWFYDPAADHQERYMFLQREGIDYFIVGPDESFDEKTLPSFEGYDDFYQKVFSQGVVSVYELRDGLN